MFLRDSDSKLLTFYERLSAEQSNVSFELRAILKDLIPFANEKISYGVPFFSLNRRICFIWPTDIPRSGVVEKGVLFGFWYGHELLHKKEEFRGSGNKIVRFMVYQSLHEINIDDISIWINEALEIDAMMKLK